MQKMLREYKEKALSLGSGKEDPQAWLSARQTRAAFQGTERYELAIARCAQGTTVQA